MSDPKTDDKCKQCGACRVCDICACCGKCRECGKAATVDIVGPTVNPPTLIPIPYPVPQPQPYPVMPTPWDWWASPGVVPHAQPIWIVEQPTVTCGGFSVGDSLYNGTTELLMGGNGGAYQ